MIETRLTRALGIAHPVISAPMARASGGRLAAAVSGAGGLGLIGGGYGDAGWLSREWRVAGNASVGCGFITWALRERPGLLDTMLERKPAAVLLSFGDPAPFARRIVAAGVPLICQVQTLRDGQRAAECGAMVIVAQGTEAGGHGGSRGTMALVPELADWLARAAPKVIPVAAGGIADGRGLAAALMLGAEGVMMGSRFWASAEAEVHPAMRDAALEALGDDTIRSKVVDIARGLAWPGRYTARVLRNAFTEKWHDDPDGLIAAAEVEAPRWARAWEAGDPTTANVLVGEAVGLIDAVAPAGEILARVVAEAEALLAGGWRR